jgi:hypothetical protein
MVCRFCILFWNFIAFSNHTKICSLFESSSSIISYSFFLYIMYIIQLHSSDDEHWNLLQLSCVFLKFFSQLHIHKKILNTFSTNSHIICHQLNLNWIEFKFHSMYLTSIQWNLNSIQNALWCCSYVNFI